MSFRTMLSGRRRVSVRAHVRQNHRRVPVLVNPFRTIGARHLEQRFFRHSWYQLGRRFSNRTGKYEKTPQLRRFLCVRVHTKCHLALIF